MGWLLALFKSIPALGKILEQLERVFNNAKADAHVASTSSHIDDAIKRVHDSKPKAQKRPSDP